MYEKQNKEKVFEVFEVKIFNKVVGLKWSCASELEMTQFCTKLSIFLPVFRSWWWSPRTVTQVIAAPPGSIFVTRSVGVQKLTSHCYTGVRSWPYGHDTLREHLLWRHMEGCWEWSRSTDTPVWMFQVGATTYFIYFWPFACGQWNIPHTYVALRYFWILFAIFWEYTAVETVVIWDTNESIWLWIKFYVTPPHWHDPGRWNPCPRKTRTYLFYIVNIMGDDVLVRQGARASATMIFTQMNRINLDRAR